MSRYQVSAPAQSGFRAEFETTNEAREKATDLLGCTVDEMEERESPDGGTTYCYATVAEADADPDGAYAVQYSEIA